MDQQWKEVVIMDIDIIITITITIVTSLSSLSPSSQPIDLGHTLFVSPVVRWTCCFDWSTTSAQAVLCRVQRQE
jgi:hypothetical protein